MSAYFFPTPSFSPRLYFSEELILVLVLKPFFSLSQGSPFETHWGCEKSEEATIEKEPKKGDGLIRQNCLRLKKGFFFGWRVSNALLLRRGERRLLLLGNWVPFALSSEEQMENAAATPTNGAAWEFPPPVLAVWDSLINGRKHLQN